jgi:ribosomal protein S4
MSKIKKYKKFSRFSNIVDCSILSRRVLKFKKSKWTSFKLKINKKKKLNQKGRIKKTFLDFSKQRVGFVSSWKKANKAYKLSLDMSRFFKNFFDNSFSLRDFKSQLNFKKNFLIRFFLKPLLKLDVFLWKLRFFKSIKQTRQFIKRHTIKVNNIIIYDSIFLKKGDVVEIGKSLEPLLNNPSFISNTFFLSFCEIDFYSGTFIVLKDLNFVENKDISLFFKEKINLNSFIYYLTKN